MLGGTVIRLITKKNGATHVWYFDGDIDRGTNESVNIELLLVEFVIQSVKWSIDYRCATKEERALWKQVNLGGRLALAFEQGRIVTLNDRVHETPLQFLETVRGTSGMLHILEDNLDLLRLCTSASVH